MKVIRVPDRFDHILHDNALPELSATQQQLPLLWTKRTKPEKQSHKPVSDTLLLPWRSNFYGKSALCNFEWYGASASEKQDHLIGRYCRLTALSRPRRRFDLVLSMLVRVISFAAFGAGARNLLQVVLRFVVSISKRFSAIFAFWAVLICSYC